jgi:hypothetical protein
MRFSTLAAVAALASFCGAASAQDTGGAPSTIVNGNDEKVICVHADAPTGSRMGARKICHTNAEWRTIHANSQQLINTFQDRSAVGHGE